MVRSPAEAGSSAGTVNRPAVNRRVYGPTDLEKEDEKTQAEEGPGAGQCQGCASPGLGCSPSSPGRSYSFSFLSLGLYRAHASGRNPRSMAQYRMRIAKRTGHSGQWPQALCPAPPAWWLLAVLRNCKTHQGLVGGSVSVWEAPWLQSHQGSSRSVQSFSALPPSLRCYWPSG